MYRRRSHLNRKRREKDTQIAPQDDIHRDQLQFHLMQQQAEAGTFPAIVGEAEIEDFGAEPEPAGGKVEQDKSRSLRSKGSTPSYYAYGKSAAIEFICDETRKHHVSTVTLQAAAAKPGEERGYEWDSKTVMQLQRNELLQITAILLGKLDRAEFRHSTQYTTRSCAFEHQKNKVFVMVSERGKPIRAVGLNPEDTYQITALCLRQLKENSPWLQAGEIMSLIDETVVKMRAAGGGCDKALDAGLDDNQYDQVEVNGHAVIGRDDTSSAAGDAAKEAQPDVVEYFEHDYPD